MECFRDFFSPMQRGGATGKNDRDKPRAKNSLQLLVIRFFTTTLMIFSFSDTSYSQDNSSLSPKFATKSISSRFDTADTQNRFDITAGLSIDDVVSSPLQTNSAINDTLIRTERQQGALTFVYNVYNQNYIDNVVSGRAIDSLDLSDSVSKQIAAYEGTLLISRTLAASPMANVFAKFSEDLRAVRDSLMLRVGPSENGELGFEPQRKYGKTPTFLELRLTPNTRDGIAPRLRFGENVSLSHDFTNSATILEYNLNF